MPPNRRLGSPDSKTGRAILEAAEQVMVEEGHGAVTSRSVAARAGIHAGNVHYYFPTIDDLFIGLLDRGAERSMARMADALASPRPLAAFWQQVSDRRGLAVLDELMAAARRRPALRERVVALARETGAMQSEALRTLLPEYGIDPEQVPPELFGAVIQGTALLVLRQEALGIASDPGAMTDAVAAYIDGLEARRIG